MIRSLLIITAFVAVIASSSCKKTESCKAVIMVEDTLGRPVAGAKVVLRQDSVINPTTGVRADVLQDELTSASGEAFFDFKLEAVLNVEVQYDLLTAKDYIRLEQSETVRKTVVIK